MNKLFYASPLLFFILVGGLVAYKPELPGSGLSAAVASAKSIAGLFLDFNATNLGGSAKVKIVVVPGHEPTQGGTEYRGLAERDLVVGIADQLSQLLKTQPQYQVTQTRDESGWNPIFANYFKQQWNTIAAWRNQSTRDFAGLIASGTISLNTGPISHNTAPDSASIRLHGINKWSNDNNVDIELHLHINDYPRTHTSAPGAYRGFAIYVPEKQFLNSTTTRALALAIEKRLADVYPKSNLPGEKTGIVESQDLIAVGEYDSVSAASLLIEYGYIYEPEFTDPTLRPQTLKNMATQTYLGIQDFFNQQQ